MQKKRGVVHRWRSPSLSGKTEAQISLTPQAVPIDFHRSKPFNHDFPYNISQVINQGTMSTDTLKNLVIVGAGGHSKVVVDCLEEAGGFEIIAFVDETGEDGEWLEYRLLKNPPESHHDYFVVAIGDNLVRKRKFTQMVARGFKPATIIHPSAIISKTAEIGEGTVICAGAIINPSVSIGLNCIINTATSVDYDCIIGDHAHIAPGCRLAGAVFVGEGAFLGISSTVIPKVRIGDWSIIGAGAVVVGAVESGSTVVGVPAKKLTKRNSNP